MIFVDESVLSRLANGYKHLFYAAYAWNYRMWGESDSPAANICLFAAFLNTLQFVGILAAIEVYVRALYAFPYLLESLAIALFLLSTATHHLALVRGRQKDLRAAVGRYDAELWARLGAAVYAILSVVLSVLAMTLSRQHA
jgi:hypothetical protein